MKPVHLEFPGLIFLLKLNCGLFGSGFWWLQDSFLSWLMYSEIYRFTYFFVPGCHAEHLISAN